jgi:hypothetical protein
VKPEKICPAPLVLAALSVASLGVRPASGLPAGLEALPPGIEPQACIARLQRNCKLRSDKTRRTPLFTIGSALKKLQGT